MRIKPCLYFLGLSCFPISIMSLINIFYTFYFGYLDNLTSYFLVFVISSLTGLVFFKVGRTEHENINIYEQLFLIFLVYFLISFFISLPFYRSNYDISFINSFFGKVSKVLLVYL